MIWLNRSLFIVGIKASWHSLACCGWNFFFSPQTTWYRRMLIWFRSNVLSRERFTYPLWNFRSEFKVPWHLNFFHYSHFFIPLSKNIPFSLLPRFDSTVFRDQRAHNTLEQKYYRSALPYPPTILIMPSMIWLKRSLFIASIKASRHSVASCGWKISFFSGHERPGNLPGRFWIDGSLHEISKVSTTCLDGANFSSAVCESSHVRVARITAIPGFMAPFFHVAIQNVIVTSVTCGKR